MLVGLVKFLFRRITPRTKTEQYKESPHIMTLDNWNGLSRKSRRSKGQGEEEENQHEFAQSKHHWQLWDHLEGRAK